MKHLNLVFLTGVLFAIGLGVSGMSNADKVIGFLNLAGQWDPSLVFVMVGGIGAHLALHKLILRRKSPLFTQRFQLPKRRDVDRRLVAGSAIFGMGWGLGGFCPGPGLVSLAGLGIEALVFVLAMIGGMALFQFVDRPQKARVIEEASTC